VPGRTRCARSLREAVRGPDEEFTGDAGSAVVFVFDDVQGAAKASG
jgi:hypothetical protein